MDENYPDISCVVIGINSACTLASCLRSIPESDYKGRIEVIYVDGGSSDDSVRIARRIEGVEVIELKSTEPTPGRQRNAGWKAAKGELIQFLDSDTQVEAQWLKIAAGRINGQTVAVCGYRRELFPDKNWFHMVADIEWNLDSGKIKYFGGDVLVKRSVLVKTGGYNEKLISEEDAELSFRIREGGSSIIRLDKIMCHHDINMSDIGKYFKRSLRTGYTFADAGSMLYKKGEKDLTLRIYKTIAKVSGTAILLSVWVFLRNPGLIVVAVLLNIGPIVKIPYFKKKYRLNFKKSILYSLHLIVWAYPAAVGMLRYYVGRPFYGPLTNRRLLSDVIRNGVSDQTGV